MGFKSNLQGWLRGYLVVTHFDALVSSLRDDWYGNDEPIKI